METFEQQFENLDLRINVTNDAMQSATTMPSAQSDADLLMQQVADENGIELNFSMPVTQSTGITSSLAIGISNASHDQDELSKRLAKLRQP
jgi:charged multivesicular body protein 1